jgi:hypothetical protein
LKVNFQDYPYAHFVWSGWSAAADKGGLTRKIELSNLIWEGLEEFDLLELSYSETSPVLEKLIN